MNQFDSIVVGGGHNGLVAAAYLAKSGQSVLLLERNDATGGLAATREFHPGYHAAPVHSLAHFSSAVIEELRLADFGFKAQAQPLKTIGLAEHRDAVILDKARLTGVNTDDVDAYQSYSTLMHDCAQILAPFWAKTMPSIGSRSLPDLMTFAKLGLKLKLSGKKTMREFLRIASLPTQDLMDEYFDDDVLKAMLAWDGLIGARMAPRSPNSAVLAMLYRMSEASIASLGSHTIPTGGINALLAALRSSAESHGAEIRCGANVDRILINGDEDGLSTSGVQLAGGEKILAKRVIAATDPKTAFFDLVGVENLNIGFTNQIRRLRCEGLVAKLHLALDGEPQFRGLDGCGDRMIIAENLNQIEFAFDNAKYGELPQEPVMEVVVPSVADASLAPAGKHVLSAHVMYVPHKLKGGWSKAACNSMADRAIAALEKVAPNIREHIVHSELLSPQDLEDTYHVTGGHWHHTEFAMDQLLMMRPTYGAAQYSTPIPGLFLCSAGSHPGGDVTGLAGRNAASEILR